MTMYVIITNTSIYKTDYHQLGPTYKFHKTSCCCTMYCNVSSPHWILHSCVAFILHSYFDKTDVSRLHAPICICVRR